MAEIKVLPKSVAELIAAGEVVERPASVIKELVENSIDAGATLITVEIQNGGVTFMRVTDNGCGIERNQVATAFLRHATSKVSTENDLNSIATLGFRGEALAAISSVSRIEMLTKTKSDDTGTVYRCEGGNGIETDDAGCPDGTTIIVRDLFFNTPARMKFLKKDVTEGNAVAALLEHIALSHPEVSVKFIRDGKSIFTSSGDGKLMSAVYAVLGREFAATLVPLEGEMGGIKVSGYVSVPTACRPKRNAQFVFLNGRYVRSVTVSTALETAYKNSVMVGKYPAAVLHLTVPYGAVDINVHPAKTEVRFSDDRRIFDCVMYSVKNALLNGDRRPEMKLPQKSPQIRMSADEYRQTVIPEIKKAKANPLDTYEKMIKNAVQHEKPIFNQGNAYNGIKVPNVPVVPSVSETDESKPAEVPIRQEQIIDLIEDIPKIPEVEKEVIEEVETSLPMEIEYIGEVFATYIIVRRGESLFLIDKHAAHERMLFNNLKRSDGNTPQLLLTPKKITLNRDDLSVVCDNLDLFSKAGFEIEPFSDNAVIVRAMPSVLSGDDVSAVIFEAAASLGSKRTIELDKLERLYETMSCRAAVKAGNLSSPEELKKLAQTVLLSKEIMYCPHGRPVAIELSRREIEKQFGRLQ